jgi:glycosyltransferase involved in cell wall biosynthesis
VTGSSDSFALSERPCHPRDLSRSELLSHSNIAIDASAFKLSILMPAYNEQSTITRAIDEILTTDYPCEIELIVVDDGSTDATGALLSQVHDKRLIVHRHRINQGKGAALRSAAALATGTHLLPFDADMEYTAEDIPKMLDPVLKGRCNVVYGARLFGCNTVYQSYRYAVGNRLLTLMTNMLFNAHISDLHTCLKLIPAHMLKELDLSENRFGLDTELTALLLKRGVRPFEVPVSYYSRSHAQGKKITWRDAVRCVWILLRVRLWSHSSHNSANDIRTLSNHYEAPSAGRSSKSTLRMASYTPHFRGAEVGAHCIQPSAYFCGWTPETAIGQVEHD